MSVLGELQPNKVFKYFEEICSIPHGSRNLQQISDYLVDFAKAHELKYRQDEDLNVIIWKDGSKGYEASEPVILQGHMDMVAVKEADCDKDMEKEGLDLEINEDYISAKGTSLGGDDGIAVAYTLAVLDDEEMAHPPIEAIFTVNEEIGMLGAATIDVSDLKGRLFKMCIRDSLYTFKYSRVLFECYGTRQVIALSILFYCKTEFCFFAIFYIMYGIGI